jgi:hypothetical protein
LALSRQIAPLKKPGIEELRLRLGFFFFPGAPRGFDDQAALESVGRDPDVADFAVDERLHALEIRHELALRNGGDVRADAAFFLRLAAAPDVVAFNWPRAGDFTNSCHKNIVPSKGRVKLTIRRTDASLFWLFLLGSYFARITTIAFVAMLDW